MQSINKELAGIVVKGKGNGRKLGFRTANIIPDCAFDGYLGVYASYVYVCGKKFIGITNIGPRPSIDSDNSITVETHIIDFDSDIYSTEIRVVLMYYLRSTKRFENIGDLIRQLDCDKKAALNLLNSSSR